MSTAVNQSRPVSGNQVDPPQPFRMPIPVLISTGLLVVLAGALRYYRIGVYELWADEAYSYLSARYPEWLGLPTFSNNTPPLYFWLLKAWLAIVEVDEAGIRLLSAVIGTTFVAATVWTGRRLFGSTVGLWSGTLAALSPYHIYYSQEARSYVLTALMLTITYGLLVHAHEVDTRRSWILVGTTAALSLYSHQLAVLGLVTTPLLSWCLNPHSTRKTLIGYGWAVGVTVLLFTPWVVTSFYLGGSHPLEDPEIGWLARFWEQLPPSLAIPKSLEMLSIGGHKGFLAAGNKQAFYLEYPTWLRVLSLTAFACAFIRALIPFRGQAPDRPRNWWISAWLLITLFFPLVFLWLFSYWVRPAYIVGRYDMISFPAFVLLGGVGMAKLWTDSGRWRLLERSIPLCLVLLLSVDLYLFYRAPVPMEYRPKAERLLHMIENRDSALIFTDPSGHGILYYLDRSGYSWQSGVCRHRTRPHQFPCHFFPSDAENTLLGFSDSGLSVQDIRQDAVRFASEVGADGLILLASYHSGLRKIDQIFVGELEQLGWARAFLVVEPTLSLRVYGFRRQPI